MQVNIVELESDDVIYTFSSRVRFADKLKELRVHVRVHECDFSRAGHYQVSLLIDGEPVAQRVIEIYVKGEQP